MNNMFKDCTIVIPARLGSKGLPLKNRKLVPIALDSFKNLENNIIVTTDDPKIIEYIENLSLKNIKVRNRPSDLAKDDTSMKDTIIDVIKFYNLEGDIIILYPTYPERTVSDVMKIHDFYVENNLKSSLCSKEIKTHPYMCLKKSNEIFAKPIFDHKLYRRQDYPDCFEISHFVVIINCAEINNVNSQMYNRQTGFYKVSDKIDVDYKEDFENYKQ